MSEAMKAYFEALERLMKTCDEVSAKMKELSKENADEHRS